ncbi:MAG: hypothetical protein Q7V12_05245, partial [Deltaproteobacteria bacterium]|nr:hypothetical protein [Deltaproteobacteria bacterium]
RFIRIRKSFNPLSYIFISGFRRESEDGAIEDKGPVKFIEEVLAGKGEGFEIDPCSQMILSQQGK